MTKDASVKKDIILIVVCVIAIGLAIFLIRAIEKERKAVKNLDEERYNRMIAEESLQKNAAKLMALDTQLKSAQDKMNKVQDILSQEKNVNEGLKKQYDELAQTKAELEGKLKSAMEEKVALESQATAVSQPVSEAAVEQPAGASQ